MEHNEEITANARFAYRFTYNNYTAAGEAALKGWLQENTKYAVYGHELAPTTGTPHLQGYFSLKNKARMLTIQPHLKSIAVGLSLLNADRSAAVNRNYATKDKTDIFEHGTIPYAEQGTRTDLKKVAVELSKKRPLTELIKEDVDNAVVFIKYHRGLEKLEALYETPPTERPLEVIVIFGDPDTGKSTWAKELCEETGSMYKLAHPGVGRPLYWDRYNRELGVWIDEFNGWINPTQLNEFLDKWTIKLDCRGYYCYSYYKRIVITSNYRPEEWWTEKVIWNKQALFRRLTHIYQFLGTSYLNCAVKKLK